eukprot:3339975-Pyramimonas_sp.AAC.1
MDSSACSRRPDGGKELGNQRDRKRLKWRGGLWRLRALAGVFTPRGSVRRIDCSALCELRLLTGPLAVKVEAVGLQG